MKSMSCEDLGGPCDLRHSGKDANEIIKAQDRHLREMVDNGDEAHGDALKDMKGRWRNPISGMGWYRKVKRDFAAISEN